jgi:hypothetical protein
LITPSRKPVSPTTSKSIKITWIHYFHQVPRKTIKRKKEREGAGTLLYSMQMVRLIVATLSRTITYNELLIGKLLYSKTIKKKKKEREGAETLLYSMQMARLIVATLNKTMTYNELLIGKLLYTKTTKKKKKEREGDGTLLYSMQIV